jgi:hypothetical protein
LRSENAGRDVETPAESAMMIKSATIKPVGHSVRFADMKIAIEEVGDAGCQTLADGCLVPGPVSGP